ncbi:hypothetical protein HKBW3S42_02166, partial [Candidatus Hakubella thermalkaliphila]
MRPQKTGKEIMAELQKPNFES